MTAIQQSDATPPKCWKIGRSHMQWQLQRNSLKKNIVMMHAVNE